MSGLEFLLQSIHLNSKEIYNLLKRKDAARFIYNTFGKR